MPSAGGGEGGPRAGSVNKLRPRPQPRSLFREREIIPTSLPESAGLNEEGMQNAKHVISVQQIVAVVIIYYELHTGPASPGDFPAASPAGSRGAGMPVRRAPGLAPQPARAPPGLLRGLSPPRPAPQAGRPLGELQDKVPSG